MTRLTTERVRELRQDLLDTRCTYCGAINPPFVEEHGVRFHVECHAPDVAKYNLRPTVAPKHYGVTHEEAGALCDGLLAEAERADRAEAEVARLRAIIAGRTTAPTDAEIDAHFAQPDDGSTGSHVGSWLITGEYGEPPMVRRSASTCKVIAEEQRARQPSWCWVPLDRNGRPCPWPTPVEGTPDGR